MDLTALCLLCLSFFATAKSSILPDSDDELLHVSIVTRTGMRTPMYLYPSDPYKDSSHWPEGMKILTNEGIQQMKKLGTILQERYDSQLPDNYTSDSLLVRSTNTSRTLTSIISLISGLYPKEAIPIFSSAIGCDDLFFSYKNCPEYDDEMQKILDSTEFKIKENQRHHLYKFLSYHLGKEVNTLDEIANIYSNFIIENMRELKLPRWSTTIYPEPLSELAGKALAVSAATEHSTRLRYGPLIKDLLENAKDADVNRPFKMNLYSAHDSNIVGILSALNVYDGTPPGFSSALLMEVYWNNTELEKYIRIFYRVDNNTDFNELSIPECEDSCSLNFMIEFLKPVIPKNINHECKRMLRLDEDELNSQSVDTNSSLVLLTACLGSAALGASLMICVSRVYKDIFSYDNDDNYYYKKINNVIKDKNRYYYQSL